MRKLDPQHRGSLRKTRWALLKRPDKAGTREEATLATMKKINTPLYRCAYLLKDYRLGEEAEAMSCASCSRSAAVETILGNREPRMMATGRI